MRRPAGGVASALLAVALAACRAAGTPGLGPGTATSAAASAAPASPEPSPAGSMTGGPAALPGTPYSAADLLEAMRDSRRPGGVPDQLETAAVASAIASQAWTWDGERWESLSVGAACGAAGCSLDLAGTPAGGAGTDLYSFAVDPASGGVELLAIDLHGYPASLEAALDAAARAALDARRLDGLALVGARWLPPPDTDRYWLAYRSGGEEGSPGVDVLLDLARGDVVDVRKIG